MRAYIIRRILLIIPTLFLVSIIVFLSVRFIPGDVIDVMESMTVVAGGTGRGSTGKRWSVCWDWTCRSGCSTDAGWEVFFCTAALARR